MLLIKCTDQLQCSICYYTKAGSPLYTFPRRWPSDRIKIIVTILFKLYEIYIMSQYEIFHKPKASEMSCDMSTGMRVQ